MEYEQILAELDDYPKAARLAAVPFAIAQAWKLPCAYERSIKLTPGRLMANRYLLAFDAHNITDSHVVFACDKLCMPSTIVAPIRKRLSRAAKFMLGFEDAGECIIFKIYLELQRRKAHTPRHHIGWKQSILDGEAGSEGVNRTSFYKPLRRAERNALAAKILGTSGQSSNCTFLLRNVLEAARSVEAELILLLVSEATRRRSYDWNVYPAKLNVADFESSIKTVADQFRIESQAIDRWLELSGRATLGHIASGHDSQGNEFLTLYYSISD